MRFILVLCVSILAAGNAKALSLPADFSKIPLLEKLSGLDWGAKEQTVISKLSKSCHYLTASLFTRDNRYPPRRDTLSFVCKAISNLQPFYVIQVSFEDEQLTRAVAIVPWNKHGASLFFAQELDPNARDTDSLERNDEVNQRISSYKHKIPSEVLPKMKEFKLSDLRHSVEKLFPPDSNRKDTYLKTWDDMLADKGVAVYYSSPSGVSKDPLITFFNSVGVVEIIATK